MKVEDSMRGGLEWEKGRVRVSWGARRDSWTRRQIQFGAVGMVDHLLFYLSGRAETGVTGYCSIGVYLMVDNNIST